MITSPTDGSVVAPGHALVVEADATPAAGGPAIAEVRFFHWGTLLLSDTEPPYRVDTSAALIGPMRVVAVAVDTAGNESPAASVRVLSDPGPSAGIRWDRIYRVLPVDDTDETVTWTASVLPGVNVGAPADDPDIWLDHVDLLVDGVVTETVPAVGCTPACTDRPTSMTGQFRWNPGSLGVGEHTVSVRPVDSAGFSRAPASGYRVIERPTLTLRRPDGQLLEDPVRVAAGSSLAVRADAATTGTDTTIRRVGLRMDGYSHTYNTNDACPVGCQPAVTVTRSWMTPHEPGTHELQVYAEVSWGLQTLVTRRVQVFPGSQIAPSYCCESTYGQTVTVSGKLRRLDTFAGLPGRRVTVQWRPSGTSSWRTLATPTTSASGWFTVRHTPGRNGRYRLSYAGVPDTLGGSSAIAYATVHPRISGRFRDREIRHGRRAYADLRTWPVQAGAVWHVQRWDNTRDRYYTVATRVIPATGRSTYSRVLRRTGIHRFRILRPATTRYGLAVHNFFLYVN
ncbi:MAG: Ig-like domain-containing protein [Actinomycetes bacterium]